MGANSFLLEKIPTQKGFGMQESKQEVTKVVSPVEMAENLPSISSVLNEFSMVNNAGRSK